MTEGGSTTSGWHYSRTDADEGQGGGPLSWEQIVALAEVGLLGHDDLVWNPALTGWVRAGDVTGLFSSSATSSALSSTPTGVDTPGPWISPAGRLRPGGTRHDAPAPDRYAAPEPTPRTEPPAGRDAAAPAPAAGPSGRRRSILLRILIPVVAVVAVLIAIGAAVETTEEGDDDAGGDPAIGATDPSETDTGTGSFEYVDWTRVYPSDELPSIRAGHTLVADPATGRLILFGGHDDETDFADTWAYDLAARTWTMLDPAGATPAARAAHSMVYHPGMEIAIMFGGWNGFYDSDETWSFDPATNSWAYLDPPGAVPAARDSHGMVYDPKTQDLILFGGWDGFQCLDDTWMYSPDTNEWTELQPAGALPPPRDGHAMVYEPHSGTVIMFGGWTGEVELNDLWAYDPAANEWTELHPTGATPPARDNHAMAYDPQSGRIVLFGGWGPTVEFADTWTYDPAANEWAELHIGGSAPSARACSSLALGTGEERLVLVGGSVGLTMLNDVWSYDSQTTTWSLLHPGSSIPSPRSGQSMTCAPDGTTAYLFGGWHGNSSFSDMWAHDLLTFEWTLLSPAGSLPAGRSYHCAVYDTKDETLIVFGGHSGSFDLNDTWAYDSATGVWTDLNPSGELPIPRDSHAMAYDESTGRVILFGGLDDGGYPLDDTWAYDPAANVWTRLDPIGAGPCARSCHSMVYDPTTRQIVLFGGSTASAPGDVISSSTPNLCSSTCGARYYPDQLNDTWTYDPAQNRWTEVVTVGGTPPPRDSHCAVYDSSAGRLIIVGGWDGSDTLQDAWAYYPSTATWTELRTTSMEPSPRCGTAVAYSALADVAILFGGWSGYASLADTWLLSD